MRSPRGLARQRAATERKGHLRGLHQPAKAGFAAQELRLQPPSGARVERRSGERISPSNADKRSRHIASPTAYAPSWEVWVCR